MASKPPIFVSCAWPYANGSLHVGHIASLLPADIVTRYFKLIGSPVLFVSGSDAHGTPISIKADHEHVSPQSIVDTYHREFVNIFDKLDFSFKENGYYSVTTSAKHSELVQSIFLQLLKKGFLEEREEIGLWSEKDKRFLSDRYIEGECPICGFDPARGDQCDNCGNLLDPLQLKKRRSKLSGDTPIEKKTKHYYFLLSKLENALRTYIDSISFLRQNTKKFTLNYFKKGLRDRAITRDLDWGIPVPIKGYESKRIYVWFEAVCGYLSASQEWAKNCGDADAWGPFWHTTQSWYVYGKDNIPFHTIIWPAILMAYDEKLSLPRFHISSEYLQIEGKKISTSRNWAIWIRNLLKDFSGDEIRFGLIMLGPESSDSNFSLKEFQARYNNEFIATLANFIQRTLKLSTKAGIQKIPIDALEDNQIFLSVSKDITNAKFRHGVQSILHYAAEGNKYLDTHEPWKLLSAKNKKADEIIVHALRRAAQLGILLEPFLPNAAKKIRTIFGIIDKYPFRYYNKEIHLNAVPQKLFEIISDEVIERQQSYLPTK